MLSSIRNPVLSSSRIIAARAFSGKSFQEVVLVEGQRTAFQTSGTLYTDLMAVDLANAAIKGVIEKTSIGPTYPDAVIYGTVIQEVRTSNIAREAALMSGFSEKIPCHTGM